MSLPSHLIIFTDGGSRGNPGPAAIGVCVESGSGEVLYEVGKTMGIGTNNEAEYQAILTSLEWLADQTLAADCQLTWKLDSKLVVEQLNKKWKIKEPRMLALAQQCWSKLKALSVPWRLTHVPRAENYRADALVNQALDAAIS